MGINEHLKQIIYWIGLGVSLVLYANTNFPSVHQVKSLEKKIETQASNKDIQRLENKIDRILFHLMEFKK